jgi:hypothetical protein
MDPDREHLRLLSIFHYVLAVIVGLIALLPTLHLTMGLAMVTGAFEMKDTPPPFAALMGWFIVAVASVIMGCGFAFAACLVVAGRALTELRRYTFCLVIAGLSCALTPFGTVLGVFTLIVLQRASVRALFGQEAFTAPSSPSPA